MQKNSDERRLQPIYIQRFFEKAFLYLGGKINPLNHSVFEVEKFPADVLNVLREDYNIQADLTGFKLCFDKQIFLDYQFNNFGSRMFYVNPGNPVFDALLKVVRNRFREEMMKGTVLISPEDHKAFLAFLVKSQITDNRPSKGVENVADETIHLVCQDKEGKKLFLTSPAKLIDLKSPADFAKAIDKPEPVNEEVIHEWCLNQITLPQLEATQKRIEADISKRKEYLKRYIEVKGRSGEGGVMLSENEMFRLGQLGDSAWLYIVYNCKLKPELVRIQNPAKNLKFETKSKGVQYFLQEKEWKKYS